jgi:hypothetical protein
MQCSNNLKQLGLALHSYHDTHDHFPSGTVSNTALEPEERLSWVVSVLPFLEQENLYKKFDVEQGWQAEGHDHAVRVPLKILQCPTQAEVSVSTSAPSSYVGVAGVGKEAARLPFSNKGCGLFGYDRVVNIKEIEDGPANTLALIETTQKLGPWAAGGQATVRGFDPGQRPYLGKEGAFGGDHRGSRGWRFFDMPVKANAGLVDGSVRRFTESTDPKIIEAMATIRGKEKVNLE